MLKTRKAFLGLAFAFALVVGGASSASAATSAELQAQINLLMAQLAAMQGPAVTVSTTFTADLTMGSTGTQVVALQTFLEQKGYLVIPVGVSKGYFGALTRAAVVRFQLANGIAPAVGYFGPLTRGKVNAMLINSPGGGTVVVVPGSSIPGCGSGAAFSSTTGQSCSAGTPTTPGTRTEGQLENEEQLGAIGNEDLEEGDDDSEVLGIEFDAEDSDMMIDRVDVDFEVTPVTGGNNNLDQYVDSVSIWLDGEELDTMDVEDADEDDDVYSFRFTGLKGMVDEGDTAELVVSVNVVSNLDGDDAGASIEVTIPVDGIRATDTKGISDEYFGSSFSEDFTVDEADGGELEISEDSDQEAMDVEVDEDEDTDDVELLTFELEAQDSDITVDEIPVTITTVGASNSQVLRNLALYQGSTLLDTKSVTGTTTSGSVTFDDLDITVDADSTDTFTIKATVNNSATTSGASGFDQGDTVVLSVAGSGIDAEDEMGDDVTVSGTATGEVMTFRLEGIIVTLVSVTELPETVDGGADRATFTLKYKVEAFGEDAYIIDEATRDDDGTYGNATGNNYGTGSTTSSVADDLTSTADDMGATFLVEEGEEETFTLTVVVTGGGGFSQVELKAIEFNDANSTTSTTFYTSNLEDFESDPVFIAN
ncbi:MAG: peptidoglycan-binding protein [bacterium]|nr:peptidoglycan-binding protein [bacterium]